MAQLLTDADLGIGGGQFMSDADMGIAMPAPVNPNAIGGVGSEISRAFNENLDALKGAYTNYKPGDQFNNLIGTGKAIAAIPGMISSPITGAARATIGRAFEAIDPLTEQQRQQFNLPDARSVADTAMMGLAPRGYSPIGPRTMPAPTPTAEDLFAAKNADYNHPAVTNLRIEPKAAADFVTNTKRAMLTEKIDPVVAPTVTKVLENLEAPRFGPAHTVDDFDLVRQSLSSVPHEEGRAAAIVRKQIDNYLGNIPKADVLSGDAALANEKLLNARGNYAAMMRDEQIANALGRAENQAGSTYSGQNLTNQTRQQLRPILNEKSGVSLKKRVFEDYTPAEIDQIRRAVNGTLTGNLSRMAEKEMKKLPVPFVGRFMGWPAKMVEDASMRRQTGILGDMLRSRSPLAQSLAPIPLPGPNPVVAGAATPNSFAQLLAALFGQQGVLMPARAQDQQ